MMKKMLIKLLPLLAICSVMGPFASHAQVSALKDHDVKEPVDISADRLEVQQKENIAVFSGNVVVTQTDLVLNSDRITVFYESKDQGSEINRLDASGKVVLKSATEEISSTWGIYDLVERIITLGGNVELKRENGVIKGNRLQLNLDTGLITLASQDKNKSNRVSGQFTAPENKEK